MVQKSLDKKSERKSQRKSHTSRTKEPPSWSELANKSNADQFSVNVGLQSIGIIAFSLITPVGGLLTSIFVVSLISSVVGFGSEKSAAFSGALTAGISSFIGSIVFSILTLGIFTVLPNIVFGILVGLIGGYIGKKLNS